MIDRDYIDYLRILHGFFNVIVGLCFIYQGSLGLKIRKARKTEDKRNIAVIKRHRKLGPILAVLGIAGYFAGAMLVYGDKGYLLEYPGHFTVGSCIALFIIITFAISRQIRSLESSWRTPHFIMGSVTLILYLIQTYLGLNILL